MQIVVASVTVTHYLSIVGGHGARRQKSQKQETEKMETEIKIRTNHFAVWKWKLHEHHGWVDLVTSHGTREDLDKSIAAAIDDAADCGDNSPSLFTRADFMECDYYESQHGDIKVETQFIVVDERGRIEQFTDEAAAQKCYDEARYDYGHDRLTCDRGGHAGPTERVVASRITVYAGTAEHRYEFNFDTTDDEVTDEMLDIQGVPDELADAVREAVECELIEVSEGE